MIQFSNKQDQRPALAHNPALVKGEKNLQSGDPWSGDPQSGDPRNTWRTPVWASDGSKTPKNLLEAFGSNTDKKVLFNDCHFNKAFNAYKYLLLEPGQVSILGPG